MSDTEYAGSKRKRSPNARSPSPPPAKSRNRRDDEGEAELERIKVNIPTIQDADPERRRERERQAALRLAEQELAGNGELAKKKEDPKVEMAKMALTRGGGAYIPPHRLRAMMAEAAAADSESAEFQRQSWDALRKSINGLINKVNVANIKYIIPELFGENLIRGRGLFARSIMRAQAASLPFTPVFAALLAIINTKLPQVGELVINRLIIQFRRSFKRNDKPTCQATLTFLAHLCNQRVLAEIIAMEVLQLLLERPTDDSVELAVGFTREVGLLLAEEEPKFNNALYEMYRDVLHSPQIDKRVQYMVEVLFQVRRDKFQENPILPEGLDLVEEEDQITHKISLTDQLSVQDGLNIFKADPEFRQHEEEYKVIKEEILGGDDDEEEDGSAGSDSEDGSDREGGREDLTGTIAIHDQTETNLVNLRRRIYLTIMSALDFEEAIHKLLKIPLVPGQEVELCNMLVECCSQERSYSKFYGLCGERLCKLNPIWSESFEQSFKTYFNTIHRYETNRLRNIARFFGHQLGTDALPWTVFEVMKMNEDDTTSSSRIFIKILLSEMVEMLGLPKLKERFADNSMRVYYAQMFPLDNPKNTRFSINFWTSIGMGALTEDMREHLKNIPAQIMAQQRQALANAPSSSSDSDSSSDSSSSDSSDSDSDSSSGRDSPPPRRRPRSVSRSRSRSPPRRSMSKRDRSISPPPRRSGRAPSRSVSRSPPRRRRRSPSSLSNRSRSPPRKRAASPPPRKGRSPSPPPRRESAPKSRARATDFYDENDRSGRPGSGRRRSPSPVRRRSDSRSRR